MTSNISTASAFLVLSSKARTRTRTTLAPKEMAISSPTFTSYDALAGRPFTETWDASQASFATVRRLMIRETFKNLSKRILAVQAILQVLGSGEACGLGRLDPDGFAGAGVLTLSGGSFLHFKGAEACDLHLLTCGKGICDRGDHSVDSGIRLRLLHTN